MKTFKKMISGALAVLTLFSCAACFGEKTGSSDADKPNEVVTDIETAPSGMVITSPAAAVAPEGKIWKLCAALANTPT